MAGIYYSKQKYLFYLPKKKKEKKNQFRGKKIPKQYSWYLLKSMLTSRSKIHIDSGAFVSSLEVSWGKWWKSCFSHFRIAGKVGNESHCKPSQVRCWRLPLCALMAPEIKQKNKKNSLRFWKFLCAISFANIKNWLIVILNVTML